jgi:hypothetical protein
LSSHHDCFTHLDSRIIPAVTRNAIAKLSIGVPKESMTGERRVGLTPEAAKLLVEAGYIARNPEYINHLNGLIGFEGDVLVVAMISIS